ncbi:MAG: hypothetical protein ACYCO5_15145 [Acidobacteriaceae bacterium]
MAKPIKDEETEAANRAEITALLIREHYRVYRPEADCYGEDLVLRFPDNPAKNQFPSGKLLPYGQLQVVQLKSRPTVDKKYKNYPSLWMLFPDPKKIPASGREWFLVPHKDLYEWMEKEHGHTKSMRKEGGGWSCPYIPKNLLTFLKNFIVIDPS